MFGDWVSELQPLAKTSIDWPLEEDLFLLID
jgi:hypothetical protein